MLDNFSVSDTKYPISVNTAWRYTRGICVVNVTLTGVDFKIRFVCRCLRGIFVFFLTTGLVHNVSSEALLDFFNARRFGRD